MFDQVKQNVGKWSRQSEDVEPAGAVDSARPATVRPGSQSPSQTQSQVPAMIGPSIRIKGDLAGEENLVIEGQVEGTIHLERNDLTIGSNGRIKADIQAKTVIVEGQIEGDIVGKEKVIIRRTGNMRGNIVAPRVTLEDGAMFKGSIEMEPETRKAADRDAGPASLIREPVAADVSAGAAVKTGKV